MHHSGLSGLGEEGAGVGGKSSALGVASGSNRVTFRAFEGVVEMYNPISMESPRWAVPII